MLMTANAAASDAILKPFLQAADDMESEAHLERLISDQVEPVIRKIIKRKFGNQYNNCHYRAHDADDVYSETILQVIQELHEFKSDRSRSINNFQSYIASVAYNVYYRYLRDRRPFRSRLKDKIRHLLARCESFSLWNEENERLCGFSSWRDLKMKAVPLNSLQQLFDGSGFLLREGASEKESLAEMISEIFARAGSPIELDGLVSIAADLLGIREGFESINEAEAEAEYSRKPPADPRPGADAELETRAYMQKLWSEIRQLRVLQRTALLLNLKDDKGRGMIAMFPLLGIASMDEMAETLEMSGEHFAELWNCLPIDDSAIALRLGITRQQVINLRKSARERLGRKMN